MDAPGEEAFLPVAGLLCPGVQALGGVLTPPSKGVVSLWRGDRARAARWPPAQGPGQDMASFLPVTPLTLGLHCPMFGTCPFWFPVSAMPTEARGGLP